MADAGKMKNIAISVCMPVYNGAAHLRECIDSILAQTFGDFELLIADDGSTDASAAIVRSYTDPRIRLISCPHDYIATLNRLLSEARGRYVARMDADDLMRPDRLRTQYDYLEAHPEVDILAGGSHTFRPGEEADNVVDRTERVGYAELVEGCVICHPTVMWRRDRMEAAGLRYEEDYIYAEDYRLWAEAVRHGLCIHNLDRVLIDYRLSLGQITSRHRATQRRNAYRIRYDLTQEWARMVEAQVNRSEAVAASANELTVVIPVHNEGDELAATLRSIRQTAGGQVDILVVDDGSTDGFDYAAAAATFGATYLHNPESLGAAAAKEKGVRCCRTPYFLLLDAHMRFYADDWTDRLLAELRRDGRQVLCCQTRVLRRRDGELVEDKVEQAFGAYVYMGKHGLMPTAAWNLSPTDAVRSGRIPCVLGAAYASSRAYWMELRGFEGLLGFGCEEPYVSLKAWLEGGGCCLLPDIVVGHIYKESSPYSRRFAKYLYSHLLVAETLLPMPLRVRAHAAACRENPTYYEIAACLLAALHERVDALRADYAARLRGNSFARVLRLNRCAQASVRDEVERRVAGLDAVMAYCREAEDRLTGDGLVDGRMGLAVLYAHYARAFRKEEYDERASRLFTDVCRRIQPDSLPLTFRDGAFGIGWALLHLAEGGFVEPDDVRGELATIDALAARTAPLRWMADLSVDSGLCGLVAYCSARLGYALRRGEAVPFAPDFLDELRQAAWRAVLVRRDNLSTTQHALLLLMRRYGEDDWCTLPPDFDDWTDLPAELPRDPRFWTPGLTGASGYALRWLTLKSIYDEAQ